MKPTGDKSPHYRLAAKLVAAVEWVPQRAKLKKECKENIAVSGKGQGRWGKQQGSLHQTCTIVHKQYKPYSLRIICLINLFFFGEILCPERQNDLKNLRFLFFLRSKKHSGIKYFGKILEFAG
jgi:hypothetical protein